MNGFDVPTEKDILSEFMNSDTNQTLESAKFIEYIGKHFPELWYKRTSEIFEISGYPFRIYTKDSLSSVGVTSLSPKTFRLLRTWMGLNKTAINNRIAFEKL